MDPPSGMHAFARHGFCRARSWWLLLATCLISFALFAARIDEGFIGADDGTLAHAAERVLNGERPQVDFYDNYTGGLSYVDAFGLKLFGMRMQSLRWMLFVFFAAWVPAIWYLASRFASPPGASLITLLAVLLEHAHLSRSRCLLVQPVLCHLWDGGAVSLYRRSSACLDISGGHCGGSFLPLQDRRPVFSRRDGSVSGV